MIEVSTEWYRSYTNYWDNVILASPKINKNSIGPHYLLQLTKHWAKYSLLGPPDNQIIYRRYIKRWA